MSSKLSSVDSFVSQFQVKYMLFNVVLKCELNCTILNYLFGVLVMNSMCFDCILNSLMESLMVTNLCKLLKALQ